MIQKARCLPVCKPFQLPTPQVLEVLRVQDLKPDTNCAAFSRGYHSLYSIQSR